MNRILKTKTERYYCYMTVQSFENHGARWAYFQTAYTPNGTTKNYSEVHLKEMEIQLIPTVLFATHHSEVPDVLFININVHCGNVQACLNPCNSSVR